MIYKDSITYPFLCFDYGNIGFAVNKENIKAAVYIKSVNVSDKISYVGVASINDRQAILLINLDMYIRDVFHIGNKRDSNFALILREDALRDINKDALYNIIGDTTDKDIVRDIVAIRVSDNIRIETIELREFVPLSGRIGSALTRYGILAVRFVKSGIYYLISIDGLIPSINTLQE